MACLHTTEGGASAAAVNAYDARRADQVSANYLVDAIEIVAETGLDGVSFAMAPWNDVVTSLEIVGHAADTDWDPRIVDNVVEFLAHVWPGPLDVLTPEVMIRELEAGHGIPAGVSCHVWLNAVTRHFGTAFLAPLTGYTGSGNVDTSHTDPGPTLVGRIPEMATRAARLRGGPIPPNPTGGKTVLTKLTVADHWAVFYGDMDEQGVILEVFHAGPRLNSVYAPRAAKTLERTRESMKDFAPSAEMRARFPIADAPGLPAWTAADFYQGD